MRKSSSASASAARRRSDLSASALGIPSPFRGAATNLTAVYAGIRTIRESTFVQAPYPWYGGWKGGGNADSHPVAGVGAGSRVARGRSRLRRRRQLLETEATSVSARVWQCRAATQNGTGPG